MKNCSVLHTELKADIAELRTEISKLRADKLSADMRRFTWYITFGVSGSIVALVKLLP